MFSDAAVLKLTCSLCPRYLVIHVVKTAKRPTSQQHKSYVCEAEALLIVSRSRLVSAAGNQSSPAACKRSATAACFEDPSS